MRKPKPKSTSKVKEWIAKNPERHAAWLRQYRVENRDAILARKQRWYKANEARLKTRAASYYDSHMDAAKLRAFKKHLRDKYGLTVEAWHELRAAHDYRCAICRRSEADMGTGSRLCVDHCHDTGEVRGLLCTDCNFGIGNLREDIHVVTRALEYLKRHKLERVA